MPTEHDEFEIFRSALNVPIPTPPPVEAQASYMDAAFHSRKSEEEVRSHFEAVWMGSCGQVLQSLRTKADLLAQRIGALAAETAPVQDLRRGRIRHVSVDCKGEPRWNLATVFEVVVPLVQAVGLLFVGWICSMSTLVEASDVYPVFDSWTNRATFTLLPALGLCAGWKMLGARVEQTKRNAYWAGVTKFGIALACIWVVLFGLTMGGVAWDISGEEGGGSVITEESSGGWINLGVWLVITGILAETLLAAPAWRQFEKGLKVVFPSKVIEDQLTVSHDAWIEEREGRRQEAEDLRGLFLGAATSLENSRTAYANEGVAAMAPTRMASRTEEMQGASSVDSIPAAGPGHRRNGNFLPGMENTQ